MRIRLRRVLLGILVPSLVAWVSLSATASIPPNLDDALTAQRDLAASRPGDARVLNDLANLLVLTGSLIEAEETYARAVAIAPDNAAIRYNHALALQQLGESKPAIKEYKVVLELDPNHAWSHYQLGTLYEAAGKRDRAVRSYARSLELDPSLLAPEVNPHIIENRLVTASLILARWGDSSTAMAPRLYQQPARITELLVAPLPEPEEDEQAPVGSEEPRPLAEEAATPGTEPQELGEDDLTPGPRPVPRAMPPAEDDFERLGDLEDPDEEDEDLEDDEAEDAVEGSEELADEPATAATPTSGGGGQVITADDLVPSFIGQVQPRGRASQGSSGGQAVPSRPTIPPTTGSGGRPAVRRPGGITPGGGGTGTTSTGRLDLLLLPDPQDQLAGRTATGRTTG